MFAPITSLETNEKRQYRDEKKATQQEKLTDVTPDYKFDLEAVIPHDDIDAMSDIEDRQPEYQRQSRNVACSPMPRQRYKDKDGSQERSEGLRGRGHSD